MLQYISLPAVRVLRPIRTSTPMRIRNQFGPVCTNTSILRNLTKANQCAFVSMHLRMWIQVDCNWIELGHGLGHVACL